MRELLKFENEFVYAVPSAYNDISVFDTVLVCFYVIILNSHVKTLFDLSERELMMLKNDRYPQVLS